jgi:hypothetical protein
VKNVKRLSEGTGEIYGKNSLKSKIVFPSFTIIFLTFWIVFGIDFVGYWTIVEGKHESTTGGGRGGGRKQNDERRHTNGNASKEEERKRKEEEKEEKEEDEDEELLEVPGTLLPLPLLSGRFREKEEGAARKTRGG